MKSAAVILALTLAAGGLPVIIENSNIPIPGRANLLQKLSQSPDANAAADALLLHYQAAGYPATSVEIEDRHGQRFVKVDVARFANISLGDGPLRTRKIADRHFAPLTNQPVYFPDFNARLETFHANSLHRAVPRLQPSDNGGVDALLRLEQSAASQFSAGYLDTGTHPLPRERFWIQGEFSDLWNHNSLTSARLTFSPHPADFHALQLGGRFFRQDGSEMVTALSYSGARADFFDAYTWQVSGEWRNPESSRGDWKLRSGMGFTFRRSNNALEFGDATSKGLADVFQLSATQSLERSWQSGLTRITANLVISPFGSDGDHGTLRPGASAEYGIVRTSVWHRQDLSADWDLIATLDGQWASDPVLQADQFALGGAAALRGLPEQFALGDRGWLGGLELRTPVIPLTESWKLRTSYFLQTGTTFDRVLKTRTQATTGGLGWQIGHDDSLRASLYSGWRLDEGGAEIHSQLTWKF